MSASRRFNVWWRTAPEKSATSAREAARHPASEIALLRALTEAVQVRTTYIVGSREDIRHADYHPSTLDDRKRSARFLMQPAHDVRSFASIPSFDFPDLHSEVAWIVDRLRSAGIEEAVVVDLTRPEFDVPVVRVVVPGLEGSDHLPDYVARRARPCGRTRREMTAFVFVGPTLRPEEVAAVLPNAICLPPVAQGDVYRAARSNPQAIGIIDGYFSGAPSVWHKEILWALSQGVHVFGSASMGALRAAELHPFGMRGVGRIFEAFLRGELEDDDEVAVVHGPPETGYLAASEPMVNVRATLDRAEAAQVISHTTRDSLQRAAKALFFPRRTWPAILKSVANVTASGADDELSRFRAQLPELCVDQKREDALEMLAMMRSSPETGAAFRPDFLFEPTHFWNDLVERIEDAREVQPAEEFEERIVDELRLQSIDAYRQARTGALLRMLVDGEAQKPGPAVSADAKRATAAGIRTALGLFSQSQLQEWMSENDLDQESFDRLVEQEARLQALARGSRPLLTRFLVDEMRLSGRYPALAERARHKADRLRELASSSAVRNVGAPNAVELRIWYFEDRHGQSIPEDIEVFAQELGFDGAAEFDRALLNEWMYSSSTSGWNSNKSGEDEPS